MAERRMFTQKITESDVFLDMPLSSQALYFHLCMNADDDGFVKNPRRISRMMGASDDDFKLLIAKKFVLLYDTGIIVIKHWRMHNLLRKDRYKETEYTEEKKSLYLKENGAYTFDSNQGKPLLATNWQPNDNQLAPQDRIGKVRLGKDSIGKVSLDSSNSYKEVVGESTEATEDCEGAVAKAPATNTTRQKRFVKPTLEEIKSYCEERNNHIDYEHFYDYYESKGWIVGRTHMKDWKATIRNWERNERNLSENKSKPFRNASKSDWSFMDV